MPINGEPLARVSALECQLQVESVMDERQGDCVVSARSCAGAVAVSSCG
jgi:hypothetical protein